MVDIERLQKLHEQATQPPWFNRTRDSDSVGCVCADVPPVREGAKTVIVATGMIDDTGYADAGMPLNADNAALITEGRNALPEMLAELRMLRSWSGDACDLLRRLADVTYADDAEECFEMVDKLEASNAV